MRKTCSHLSDFCVWSFLWETVSMEGTRQPPQPEEPTPNCCSLPHSWFRISSGKLTGELFVPCQGKVLKRVNPGVTQFWLLPHGVPLVAAGCRDRSQTGYERALTPFFHPFHWQREEIPDSHTVTHCCHPGHVSPSVWEGPITLQRSLLHQGQLRHKHSPTAAPFLFAMGARPAALPLSPPLPPSSPGESHEDSADTEVSRPAAEPLPFTWVVLNHSTSKGWFNSACSLHQTNKTAHLPFGKDEHPTVTLSLDPTQRTSSFVKTACTCYNRKHKILGMPPRQT